MARVYCTATIARQPTPMPSLSHAESVRSVLVEDGQPLSVSGMYISAECLACESQAMARARWPLPPIVLITLPCALPIKARIPSLCVSRGLGPHSKPT